MRNWTVALSALALAVSPAFADTLGLKNLTTDGSIEVLGVSAGNETDFSDPANDHRGNTVTRVRVGVSADVADDVKARVEAVRNPDSGATAQYGNSGRPTDLNSEQTAIKIQNAYLDLANFLELDSVRLGRQYVGRANDAIVYFGPVNDDGLNVSALDAVSVTKKVGMVNVTAVTGKVADDDATPGNAGAVDAGDATGDQNASWITLSSDELIKSDSFRIPLEIGYYNGTDANTAAANDNINLTVIDLRAGLACPKDTWKVGLEYAMNQGQDNNAGNEIKAKGTLLMLSGSWKPEGKPYGAKAEFVSASGDDTADTSDKSFHDISGDYRYGEILSNDNVLNQAFPMVTGAGLDTGTQGPGLNIIKIGGHYTLPAWDEKVTVYADVIMAKTSKGVAIVGGTSKKIGNEIDLALKYKHSDSVMAKIGYAMLTPDDVLTGGGSANDDAVSKMFAKLMVKWGNN